MLVVVVLPLVPVTRITLYPLVTVDKMSLSNVSAIFPGKFEPPLNKTLLSFSTVLETIIAINELILIFHTSFISYIIIIDKFLMFISIILISI